MNLLLVMANHVSKSHNRQQVLSQYHNVRYGSANIYGWVAMNKATELQTETEEIQFHILNEH